MRATFAAFCALPLSFVLAGPQTFLRTAQAQPAAVETDPATEIDEELERERAIVERFLAVLERNPRRGTALDKIYGFHVDAGTLEAFVAELRAMAEKENDGARWMTLGLVESQRGRDASAVEALTKAVELRPTDPLAPHYLGQSLVLVGRPDDAVAAFEQAIVRKPAPNDLLETFQSLGRVHQRAQRVEQALAVWKRLEELFPGDARVQERIAASLAEEGQYAEALPRYEALAASTQDDYRKTSFRLEAADLKVKLDRSQEAIADLEGMLGALNPDSWLFREVRKKIEDVFLRTEDREGLAAYYEAWIAKRPDDVDAMARLAKTLTSQGRIPEARARLEAALKLAPSRSDLRTAFIAQLVETKSFSAALEQYAALDELDPGNPDRLREWGKLHLRDESRPEEERKQAAAAVWRRIVEARPTDPLAAAQTADLLRRGKLDDEALALYRKAVELAPVAPQYREYLGEYLHVLERPDEAREVWREIASGERRTAENLARLAEILVRFGYFEEALPEIAAACELDPKNFGLHLEAADLRVRAEKYDEAFASLDAADALAQNDEEFESVLSRRIRALQAAELLDGKTEELQAAVANDATPEQWFLLARYREASRQLPEATAAIEKALQLRPNDVRSLDAAARIAESSGSLLQAAELFRKLATVDRRGRTNYLERVAALESQLGRTEEALAAGRELIAAAPGNVDAYQFFADLCARLNRHDEGIAALRRATRVNPDEPNLSLSLAAALADRFRTDEAIETYWQAYEKSGSLDDQLLVIGKQTDLYLQSNRFDQLLERLERGRAEPEGRREATICLAQAYHSAGDYGMARQELESLLGESSRDTQLLQQLSKLAETESDLASAIQFQERLVESAPGPETEYRLATLLSSNGDQDAAAEILVRLSLAEEDRAKLMRNVDRLLGGDQATTALAILEAKRRQLPDDWELLYREGVALTKLERPADAQESFEAVLALDVPDNEKSATAPTPNAVASRTTQPPTIYTNLSRSRSDAAMISRELKLDPEYRYYPTSQSSWAPPTYGAARTASLGWLYGAAAAEGRDKEFLAEREAKATRNGSTATDALDWFRLLSVLPDQRDVLEAAKLLARRGILAGQYEYLTRPNPDRARPTASGATAGPTDATLEPLPAEDLDLALQSYEALDKADGDARPPYSVASNLIAELDRAGRREESDRINRQKLDEAKTGSQWIDVMALAVHRGDYAELPKAFGRFVQADLEERRNKRNAVLNLPTTLQAAFAAEKLDASVKLALLDAFFDWKSAASAIDRERASRRPSFAPNQQLNLSYAVGGSYRRLSETPLAPSDRFDNYSISFLRTAYDEFREGDLLSDLTDRLEAAADDPNQPARDVRLFAVAYVRRWSDDQEGCVEAMQRCVDAFPQDFQLRLAVAALHQSQGDLDEALAVVDSLAPTDQASLQQRETLALDLAVRLGDRERARDAARRLFGLRLPSETQVSLAAQMQRLGMHEEAEAALARAGNQAGGRLAALAALMTQYRSQGENEVAVEIAYRILRRSRTKSSSSSPYVTTGSDEGFRLQALQCLSSAGQLDDSIAEIKEQIERTPQATQLYETLAEYCRAKGDAKQETETLSKLVELKPKDSFLRVDFANRLTSRGDAGRACDLYLEAIALDPNVLENDVYRMSQTFRSAGRMSDLAGALDKLDFKKVRQPHSLLNLVGNLSQEEDHRPLAVKIAKKTWEAFPELRQNILSSLYSDQIWQDPEIAKLAMEGIVPAEGGRAVDPWHGFDGGLSYQGDGRILPAATRVLAACERAGTMDSFRERVAAAVERRPEWKAGRFLLLAIDLRLKRSIDLDAEVSAVLEAKPAAASGYTIAAWFLAQEIEAAPERRETALKVYESLKGAPNSNSQFQYSPRYRAFQLYREMGQPEKATAVLQAAISETSGASVTDPYERARLVQDFISLGQSLTEAGEPLEAVRMYRRVLSDPKLNDPEVARNYSSDPDYFRRQATSGMEQAISSAMHDPDAEGEIGEALDAALTASPDAGIDLMVVEQTDRRENISRLVSPILDLLARTRGETRERLARRLDEAVAERPDDLSAAIAGAFLALQGSDEAAARVSVERLAATAERMPLETIPEGRRPNSRQRRDAEPQTALWLVARDAWKRPELRDAANRLADRAVEAAGRQLEPGRLVAILVERGLVASDEGEVAFAEAVWNDLLDRALVQPSRVKGDETARAPATISRFNMATSLAVLAADRKLPAVSIRAMREALAGGLPVPDAPVGLGQTPQRVVMMRGGVLATDQEDNELALAADGVRQASQAWKRANVPAVEASQALEAIVLPTARPKEVLLLASTIDLTSSEANSVGRELAYWATKADRTQQVAAAVAERTGSIDDEVNGNVLLALLAIERKDAAALEEALTKLQARVKETAPAVRAVAAHAPVAALDVSELEDVALSFAEDAIAQLTSDENSGRMRWSYGSSQDSLPTKIIRLMNKKGRREQADALVERLCETRRQSFTAQGEWGLAYYRQELGVFADVQSEAGDLETTLKALARYLDSPQTPSSRQYVVGSGPTTSIELLGDQLAPLDANARYERLRDWTLPDDRRRTLRSLILMESWASVPEEFLPAGAPRRERTDLGMHSTLGLLVNAAKQADRLAELSQATTPLVDAKLPDADLLDLLVRLAQNDGEGAGDRLRTLAEEARKRPDDAPKEPAPESERSADRQALEAYVAATALRQANAAEPAEEFLRELLSEYDHRNNSQLQVYASRQLVRRRAAQAGGDYEAPFRSPDLAYWNSENGAGAAPGGPYGPVWIAHDGVVVHLAGSSHDRLFLKYPVVGEFSLSFESTTGWAKQGEVGYGGAVVEPQPWAKNVLVRDASGRDTFNRPALPQLWDEGWDRTEIRVSPTSVRWYVNDFLAFEDRSPSPTSPWLYLVSYYERRTHFRNIRLEGSPQILQEVALVEGDFLDGWQSAGWEGLPARLSQEEQKRTGTTSDERRASSSEPPMWKAEAGALTARSFPNVQTDMPSLLSYFRGLQPGETVSYEFFWDPGLVEVHPAIGQTAMRLSPEGIRLRRYRHPQIPLASDALNAKDEVDVPAYRRGPDALPLRVGEWNQAEVRMEQNQASLSLNGEEIYVLPVDATKDRRFGFFRFLDRDEVRVRNVRLRGDWPEEFPVAAFADPLALAVEPSPEVRLARHAAVTEHMYAWNSYGVLRDAAALSPEPRYEFLRSWVLPNENHPTFRLATSFAPVDPPELEYADPAERDSGRPARSHAGGQIASPALELVRVAAELGRLDDLAAEIDAASAAPGMTPDPRSVEALKTAIDLSRGDVNAARARLKAAIVAAEEVEPSELVFRRGAEVVAILAALERPELIGDARELARRLVELSDAPSTNDQWRPDVRRIWNVARSTGDPLAGTREEGLPPGVLHWDAVSHSTAGTRGLGLPPASWRVANGEAEFLTGDGRDALYLDTPLVGDFELTCSLGMGDYREMRALYGGVAILPSRDGKELHFQPFGRSDQVVSVDPPGKIGERIDLRLVVRDRQMTVFVDGREIGKRGLGESPDPWLGFSSKESYCYGSVRDVRIAGSPTVPEQVELFAGPDLLGSRASHFDESIEGEQADWKKQGDEIKAQKLENAEGSFRESVLQYHRPMLEDGEIEFEFFWKAGETEVHPALDRLVFVLRPQGVGLHAITDGKWDRTGAKPGDVRDLSGAVPVPLKEGDWNRARLALVGDVATLYINDVEVASRELAPTNQRNFGLFRWTDASGVRVRNILHRGAWPDAVPPEAEQGFVTKPTE